MIITLIGGGFPILWAAQELTKNKKIKILHILTSKRHAEEQLYKIKRFAEEGT